MISFNDWVAIRESSAATRSKKEAAKGTGPDVASPFGHSTPSPDVSKKIVDKLGKKKKKKDDDKKGNSFLTNLHNRHDDKDDDDNDNDETDGSDSDSGDSGGE
jgi:hypothetical protein